MVEELVFRVIMKQRMPLHGLQPSLQFPVVIVSMTAECQGTVLIDCPMREKLDKTSL